MQLTESKFSQESKKTIKWVIAGVTLFGIVYFGRQLFRKITRNNKTPTNQHQKQNGQKSDKKTPERMNTRMTEYSEFYFDKDQQLRMISTCISENPSVEEIYLNSPLIARDEFIKYTRQMRKRRRLIRKINEDQYINTILTYQSQIHQLLFRSRIQLVEFLEMNPQIFSHMQQHYEAIEDLPALSQKSLNLLRQKMLTETKPKKMSIEKLKQIVQQQMHFMKNKMYTRIREKLQNEMSVRQDQILIIVETLLEDIVYEKFGYEQEDVVRKMQQICFDDRQLQQARTKMRSDIAEFNYDSLESLADPQSVHEIQNLQKSRRTLQKSEQENEN